MNPNLRYNLPGLISVFAALASSPAARAWSSRNILFFEEVHQQAIQNVLGSEPGMTKDLLGILTQEQALTDAEGNQTASRSFLHAMTGVIKGTTVSPILVNQYVNATNGYIATCLNNAIVARKAGQMTEAMTELGLAIHPMEDATSPAHIGFQPWSDDESAWQITQHIMKEDVYPDDPSDPNQRAQLIQLEGAVRYAYAIYLGRAPLPAQFFDAQFHLVIPPSFCFAPPS